MDYLKILHQYWGYPDFRGIQREIIESIEPDVDFEVDENGWYAKDMITLEGEDLEVFNKLYNMLDEIEDVTDIYTNVNME